MTVIAFFGDDDITLATSDVSEGADTCSITASAVNASLDLQEGGDACTIQTFGAVTVAIAATEGADICALAANVTNPTTIGGVESPDICYILAAPLQVAPAPAPAGDIKVPARPFTVFVNDPQFEVVLDEE